MFIFPDREVFTILHVYLREIRTREHLLLNVMLRIGGIWEIFGYPDPEHIRTETSGFPGFFESAHPSYAFIKVARDMR